MPTQTTPLTQNDRLLGAAAHAGIALNFFSGNLAGLAIAAIIWLTQREKSRWVGFQALQALIYQAAGLVLLLILFVCWALFYFLSFIPLMVRPEAYADAPPPLFVFSLATLCIPLTLMGVWVLYGLYGALRAYSGADFRYVLLGDWLAQRTANAPVKTTDT